MVSANAVTAPLLIPCCARRVVSVAPIIAKPKPEEMPRNSAASGPASRYGRRPSGSRLAQGGVIVDGQRCVVGEALFLVDARALRLRGDPRRRDLVVDAPADVLLPRLAAVRPPGVLPRARVDAAEHVHPADLVERLAEPGALLGQEAGVIAVAAPVLEVDLLVRDVPVAAEHELAAARAQRFQHRHELVEEPELRFLPLLRARARGHVNRDDRELAEIGLEVAPLRIELAAAVAAGDPVGPLARVERDAAVAFLGGRAVVVPVKALRHQREPGEVRLLRLDLLKAHDVGLLASEPARKTLRERRAYAVEVERDNA